MDHSAVKKNYYLTVAPGKTDISGVTEIIEYSDKFALVKIQGGVIEINGVDLRLVSLDAEKNSAVFSGDVSSAKISDKYVKAGFWSKIFR